jgi:hypothetical protein
MVGLFLALLELVRAGLVSAEAAGDSFILKALTDEPAELAVQKILAVAQAGEVPLNLESSEGRGQKTDDRIPSRETSHESRVTKSIPVVEIPPDGKKSSAGYQKVEPHRTDSQHRAN